MELKIRTQKEVLKDYEKQLKELLAKEWFLTWEIIKGEIYNTTNVCTMVVFTLVDNVSGLSRKIEIEIQLYRSDENYTRTLNYEFIVVSTLMASINTRECGWFTAHEMLAFGNIIRELETNDYEVLLVEEVKDDE